MMYVSAFTFILSPSDMENYYALNSDLNENKSLEFLLRYGKTNYTCFIYRKFRDKNHWVLNA